MNRLRLTKLKPISLSLPEISHLVTGWGRGKEIHICWHPCVGIHQLPSTIHYLAIKDAYDRPELRITRIISSSHIQDTRKPIFCSTITIIYLLGCGYGASYLAANILIADDYIELIKRQLLLFGWRAAPLIGSGLSKRVYLAIGGRAGRFLDYISSAFLLHVRTDQPPVLLLFRRHCPGDRNTLSPSIKWVLNCHLSNGTGLAQLNRIPLPLEITACMQLLIMQCSIIVTLWLWIYAAVELAGGCKWATANGLWIDWMRHSDGHNLKWHDNGNWSLIYRENTFICRDSLVSHTHNLSMVLNLICQLSSLSDKLRPIQFSVRPLFN